MKTLKKGTMKLWKTHKAVLHDSLKASPIYSPNLKTLNIKHPQNYRPITCLLKMYENFTSIVAERKGCWRESYGGRDQLLINKMVVEEVKLRKKNLSMAWIDYRKAFDSVPYSWIEKTLAQPSQGSLQRMWNLGKQPYNSTTPEGQSYPGR